MSQEVTVKYIEDNEGNKVAPITHISAVRDSEGNTVEDILEGIGTAASKDVDTSIGSSSSSNLPTSDAVKAYVASVMINPISDSSILLNTEFSERDVLSVNGTMYMADDDTSDLPLTKPVVQDSKILTHNGKVLLAPSSTTSADWHSF